MENTKNHDAATEPEDDLFTNTPIGTVRSMQAFMRDLPALLANPNYDCWCVCYYGDECIGISESNVELIR